MRINLEVLTVSTISVSTIINAIFTLIVFIEFNNQEQSGNCAEDLASCQTAQPSLYQAFIVMMLSSFSIFLMGLLITFKSQFWTRERTRNFYIRWTRSHGGLFLMCFIVQMVIFFSHDTDDPECSVSLRNCEKIMFNGLISFLELIIILILNGVMLILLLRSLLTKETNIVEKIDGTHFIIPPNTTEQVFVTYGRFDDNLPSSGEENNDSSLA
jgi:hypothetical protein